MQKKKTQNKKAPAAKGKKQGGGMKALWENIAKGDNVRFFIGLFLLIVSVFLIVAFASHIFTGTDDQAALEAGNIQDAANWGGVLGARAAYYFMDRGFGLAAFFLPFFFVAAGMKLMRTYKIRLWKWFINCGFLLVWLSVALSLIEVTFLQSRESVLAFSLGGRHGQQVCQFLKTNVGTFACFAIVVVFAICYLTYLSHETIEVVRRMMRPHKIVKDGWNRIHPTKETPDEEGYSLPAEDQEVEGEDAAPQAAEGDENYSESYRVSLDFGTNESEEAEPQVELEVAEGGESEEGEGPAPEAAPVEGPTDNPTANELLAKYGEYNPRLDLSHYQFPEINLLKKYPDEAHSVDMAEQNANKNRIIKVLKDFGVEIVSIKATIGPTITLYEITPAPGVKISKIRNLEDDIALSLSALGIRIIAPIPGKGTIGIEVPNRNPHIVSMESIVNTKKFQECTYELPIALGKTITNEVFMVDLAKMPHLLVAGATGQGKSVGLNAIITSLLYKKHPAELKFVMVDPKKVEFSVYSPIENHFLARIPEEDDAIITDVTKVVQTLKSLCTLMDHRYDLLKKAKARNIKEYNAKFRTRQLNPENGHEFMPYIVIIIDEFGDLIMTAGKEVELPIARIAQLARAVGMHMVIATQRPTTNIITGTIKANFPARIAFKVSQRIDSMTILDRPGANQLIGKGDMLFLSGNSPIRVQCAFVDTPEVEDICSYISNQQGYISPFLLPDTPSDGDNDSPKEGGEQERIDPMFQQAAELIVYQQQGSTSLIQRKFAIGYNRAGRIMDQLERAGIVGPARGSKPRDVLCADINELEAKISTLGSMI